MAARWYPDPPSPKGGEGEQLSKAFQGLEVTYCAGENCSCPPYGPNGGPVDGVSYCDAREYETMSAAEADALEELEDPHVRFNESLYAPWGEFDGAAIPLSDVCEEAKAEPEEQSKGKVEVYDESDYDSDRGSDEPYGGENYRDRMFEELEEPEAKAKPEEQSKGKVEVYDDSDDDDVWYCDSCGTWNSREIENCTHCMDSHDFYRYNDRAFDGCFQLGGVDREAKAKAKAEAKAQLASAKAEAELAEDSESEHGSWYCDSCGAANSWYPEFCRYCNGHEDRWAKAKAKAEAERDAEAEAEDSEAEANAWDCNVCGSWNSEEIENCTNCAYHIAEAKAEREAITSQSESQGVTQKTKAKGKKGRFRGISLKVLAERNDNSYQTRMARDVLEGMHQVVISESSQCDQEECSYSDKECYPLPRGEDDFNLYREREQYKEPESPFEPELEPYGSGNTWEEECESNEE